MAAASLLTLLDDIASLLDDVSVMAKVAAKKTAGVLGDDLALNAQQVSGVEASRELPVVWAVCKGSLLNKLILVPAALAISSFAPWLVTPLLMLGGAYLCYEGFEKIAHRFMHSSGDDADLLSEEKRAVAGAPVDLVAFEREKIKGAVRTDFILSAEIIAITLGVVQGEAFLSRVLVMSGIALVMTVGVYGFVAAIVRLDDVGLYLVRSASGAGQRVGRGILWVAPWLMKGLSLLGTVAMFLVGGGILVHGVPVLGHWIAALVGAGLAAGVLNGVVGVAAGAVVFGFIYLVGRVRK